MKLSVLDLFLPKIGFFVICFSCRKIHLKGYGFKIRAKTPFLSEFLPHSLSGMWLTTKNTFF